MVDVKLVVKTSTGEKYNVEAGLDITVEGLKAKIEAVSSVPVSAQKLIFAGRILKNEATLESCGVKEGTSLHLVKAKKPAPATAPAGGTATASMAGARTSGADYASGAGTNQNQNAGAAPRTNANPFAGLDSLGGFGAMGAMGGGNVPSPEQLGQMMDNPVVQSMLNSPEVMEAMIMSNPQMRQIVDQNPELGRAMRDPAVIRQAMEMQRNPAMMRESMRQHDRAMQNVESLPGGFNHLRQMYNNVQAPLERAADSMHRESQQPQASSGSSGAAAQASAANPFAALFASQSGTQENPTSNTPSNTGSQASSASLFNNPIILESMRQAMANPEILQQMGAMNPYMNAEALRDPANLEAMTKLLQSMQQLEGAGITQLTQNAAAGQTQPSVEALSQMLGNPALMESMRQPENLQAMMDLQRSMQTLQRANLLPAQGPDATAGLDLAGMSNLGLAPSGFPGAQANPQQTNYSERFATEISEIRTMGFSNEAAIIQALIVCDGNVERAINFLLG